MTFSVESDLRHAAKDAVSARGNAVIDVAARAGYSVEEFCFAVGIGRTSFYGLPAALAPSRIKLGKRTIVTESPSAWVSRVAELQREAA